jgi:hypothetical protein
MELFEYVPGALAAGWMVVRLAILIKNGPQAMQEDRAA